MVVTVNNGVGSLLEAAKAPDSAKDWVSLAKTEDPSPFGRGIAAR